MIKKMLILLIIAIMATGCSKTEQMPFETEKQDEQSVMDSIETKEEVEVTLESELLDPKDEIDLSLKPMNQAK